MTDQTKGEMSRRGLLGGAGGLAAAAITVKGEWLPPAVQAFSGVDAPLKPL